MRVYRRYRCDLGHQWEIERKQGDPEQSGDIHCSAGHEAVTCNEEEPADEVQIVFRPAARIVDKATGELSLTGYYWLVLLDRNDEELCRSSRTYKSDEVLNLAKLFMGKDRAAAVEWWARRQP